MKNLLLITALCGVSSVGISQLTGISVDEIAMHDTTGIAGLEGMTTYHIYALMTHPEDELSAVYGDYATPFSLISTEVFYQAPIGGANVGWQINSALFPFLPEVAYDSWLTIGVSNQSEMVGQPNSIGFGEAFALFDSGNNLILNSEIGGSIFTLAGDPMAQAGEDLKVLVAQLTTSGVLSGILNIQMFVEGLQSQYANYEGIVIGGTTGCTNYDADNYDTDATSDDGTCIIGGCHYTGTSNYNPEATYDDGSCLFTGCTNTEAVNFDSEAAVDDSSCVIIGCMDPSGYDYDSTANFPGICDYPITCMADFDNDGLVDVIDMLVFFENYGYTCGE